MTWIDLALVLLLAAVTALGAERKLTGLVVGVGGVVLLHPLLLLASLAPLVALGLALAGGLALALLARRMHAARRLSPTTGALLGAAGGACLGTALILTLVSSLPIERNISNQIVYPPRDLPPALSSAVQGSRLVRLGRAILLQPLLDAQAGMAPSEQPAIRALHSYLVVGEPWDRR